MQLQIDTTGEPEVNLWVAVIRQALSDATLGISHKMAIDATKGRAREIYRAFSPYNGGYTNPSDIERARTFIKGDDGCLLEICEAIGLDYEDTLEKLNKIYQSAQPHLPECWQDTGVRGRSQ